MVAGIKIAAFTPQPLIAQLLTVIDGKDNQGVVVLSGCLQILHQATNVVIDLRNQAVIGSPQLTYFRLG